MSQTLRLFVNDKRISTAFYTKQGSLIQVYPSRKHFPSEAEWRMSWNKITNPIVKVESSLSKEKPALSEWLPIATDNWTYDGVYQYTAPPGDYYIGDLCYVFNDEFYEKVFGGQDYQPGLYLQTGSKNFFLVDNTAYGDGLYRGSDQREFAVDAGIIGITPMSCREKNDGGGQIYTFTEPVDCRFENGRFFFSSGFNELVIDTTGDDDGY
jgi:hypothetical protein